MKKDILKVAIDAIRGKVEGYSKEQASEALRSALIELNGGSLKINIKNFYRGNALFDLVQEILPVMIETGLKDSHLMNLVEYRNIALGDVNEFIVHDANEIIVSNVAKGIGSVRRQRLMGSERFRVDTEMKIVKVYENLNRLLSGRISFDQLVTAVSEGFNKRILTDCYVAIQAIGATTPGMNPLFVENGSFDEERLVTLIDRVESISGRSATIYGTRSALRRVNISAEGEVAKSSMWDFGFYGKFNGTNMVSLRQAVDKGGNFLLNNDRLLILASDDKPIKLVNEGEGLLIENPALANADLSQEYAYGQAMGISTFVSIPLGIYNFA